MATCGAKPVDYKAKYEALREQVQASAQACRDVVEALTDGPGAIVALLMGANSDHQKGGVAAYRQQADELEEILKSY